MPDALWLLLIPGLALAFFGYPLYKGLIELVGGLAGWGVGLVGGGILGALATGSFGGAVLGAIIGGAILGSLGAFLALLLHYLGVMVPGFVVGFAAGVALVALPMVGFGGAGWEEALMSLNPAEAGGAFLVVGVLGGILGAAVAVALEVFVISFFTAVGGAVLVAIPVVAALPLGVAITLLAIVSPITIFGGMIVQVGTGNGGGASPRIGPVVGTVATFVFLPFIALYRGIQRLLSSDLVGLRRREAASSGDEETPERWLQRLQDRRARVVRRTVRALDEAHAKGAFPHDSTSRVTRVVVEGLKETPLHDPRSNLYLEALERMCVSWEDVSPPPALVASASPRIEQMAEGHPLADKAQRLVAWIEENDPGERGAVGEAPVQADERPVDDHLDKAGNRFLPSDSPSVVDEVEALIHGTAEQVTFLEGEVFLTCRRRGRKLELEVGAIPCLATVVDPLPGWKDRLRELGFEVAGPDGEGNPVRYLDFDQEVVLQPAIGLVLAVFDLCYGNTPSSMLVAERRSRNETPGTAPGDRDAR